MENTNSEWKGDGILLQRISLITVYADHRLLFDVGVYDTCFQEGTQLEVSETGYYRTLALLDVYQRRNLNPVRALYDAQRTGFIELLPLETTCQELATRAPHLKFRERYANLFTQYLNQGGMKQ